MRRPALGMLVVLAAAVGPLAGCGKGQETTSVKVRQPAQRKPGLWVQTVSAEGRSQTQRLCLGEGVTSSFQTAIAQGARSCAPVKMSGTAHGFAIDAVCDHGENGTAASHAVVSGDPAKTYRLEVTTTVTGAKAPQMNRTATAVTTAAWQGPCPAGMKPGDMDLPDGTRIHPGP